MNILLVTMEMQVGGAETHILELAKELKKRNHQVFVMSAGGRYAEILEANEIVHIYAPLKDKKLNHMMQSYQIIRKTIQEKHIDIVHAHARIPGFIAGKVCKKMKIPFVTTVHGVYKVNFLFQKLTNWGEKTLTVSQDIKNQVIRDYHLLPENVGITVNGINTEEFCKKYQDDTARELDLPRDGFYITHVSRLDKASSHVAKTLIESFTAIRKNLGENAKLIIVGSGDDFASIQSFAEGKEDVILTGLRTDVAAILQCSSVFVGVSRAALEAMACELPAILAGNKDYSQGFIGIFDENHEEIAKNTNFCCRNCPEVTKEALEKSLLEIYQMSEEQKAILGAYGREMVKQHYSVEKMADDAEKMYNSVETHNVRQKGE